MANALGYVSETKTGFEGALAMMNLTSSIRIEKNADKAAEGQPDYRIYAGETSTEIGGGFIHPINGADHLMHLLAGAPAGMLIASGIAIAGVALAAAIPILRSRQS